MKGGRLRHKLTLQENTTTVSGIRPTATWADRIELWGSIEPISGSEAWRQAQASPEVTHLITVRYQATHELTPKWRFVLGTRAFGIISVLNVDERNREHQCLVKEDV